MKLIIVESPTKARTIQRYLGNDYKVIASQGHIRDLSFEGEGSLGVDVNNNFEPDYIISSNKKTIIGALKNGRIGYGTELERKYIEIGQERVSALARGELKMRPITQEIFAANKAGSLSKIPTEWLMKGYGK